MNELNPQPRLYRCRNLAVLALAVITWVGCSDSQIESYRVPKEPKRVLTAQHQHGRTPVPHVHAEPPAGWEEQPPDRLRAASYRIIGDEGRMAEVAVIPLPGVSNIELESVNLWREELGLSQLDKEQLEQAGTDVKIANLNGHLYDMVSATNKIADKFKSRTLGVIAPGPGVMWFVKMTGEDSLVAEEKQKFVQFLSSIEFHAGSHDQMASNDRVSANSGEVPPESGLPQWTVPPAWQEKPPGTMVLAAFEVSHDAGKADVTITRLSGDGGGLLANVNRWRNQLSLAPITPGDLAPLVTEVPVDGQQAPLVQLEGQTRAGTEAMTIAVSVKKGDETWFYKLMGDKEIVSAEKDTFIRFVQSAY